MQNIIKVTLSGSCTENIVVVVRNGYPIEWHRVSEPFNYFTHTFTQHLTKRGEVEYEKYTAFGQECNFAELNLWDEEVVYSNTRLTRVCRYNNPNGITIVEPIRGTHDRVVNADELLHLFSSEESVDFKKFKEISYFYRNCHNGIFLMKQKKVSLYQGITYNILVVEDAITKKPFCTVVPKNQLHADEALNWTFLLKHHDYNKLSFNANYGIIGDVKMLIQ